jgi:glucose-6-phosphate isomerase
MKTRNFHFKDFYKKKKNKKLLFFLKSLLSSNTEIIKSLQSNYVYSYKKNFVEKFKKYKDIRIFGMGGSILGAHAIYQFLKKKIKKNFYFIDNLTDINFSLKKKYLNLIISKSGNTTETIVNSNLYVKKNDKNVFISDDKPSALRYLAYQLKSEVVNHNNFIGGRYSVLSEVGMLPAELMGLKEIKFKQLNNLIKNSLFFDAIVSNVSNILELIKKKKYNSIILNYDETADNFLKWYQQLVAESLGKKGKGVFPAISTMPKDNHSLMQLYLDGSQNNFFTFFFTQENSSKIIRSSFLHTSQKFLINKNLKDISLSKMQATQRVFSKKKIPYRSFLINNRSEEALGELFCFFIIETILLGKALSVNPYDQPAVELIKNETKKILITTKTH